MKITLICALAASLGLVAACGNDNAATPTATPAAPPAASSPPPASSGASTGASATTKTTPADIGSGAGKKETNPVQGQVDPKQNEQRRDFQQKGDGAGPQSPETAPKSGG